MRNVAVGTVGRRPGRNRFQPDSLHGFRETSARSGTEDYGVESCTLQQWTRVSGCQAFAVPHGYEARGSRRAVAGAPQPMLSRDIVRISFRTSGSTAGRPPWRGRDFQVQYNRNPFRCHRTSVSGLKIYSVCKHAGQRR